MNKDDNYQYVEVTILWKQKNNEYRNLAERDYAIAGIPQVGNLIRVDGNSYTIDQVEFDTEKGLAHKVTLYVSDKPTSKGAIFF